MEYRQLGRSGLRVSTITLGTMGFGGTGWAGAVGKIDVEGARRQIALARDAGVNLIDTADVYSNGLSEEIVGQALGRDREDVLLATKVRMPMGEGPNDAGLSRHHIIRAAEASLRRLGTDHIDLYQVHEWDGQTPLEETLSAQDAKSLIDRHRHQLGFGVTCLQRIVDLLTGEARQARALGDPQRLHQVPRRVVRRADVPHLSRLHQGIQGT